MSASPPVRARLLVLCAAALFSTGGAAIKAASLSAWQVASFRSGVAALTLLALLPATRRVPDVPAIGVGAVYGATMILFVLANKLTTSANAIYLQGTAPLYVLLASPLLEPVRRADVMFMVALAAGLATFFAGYDAPQETAPAPALGNLVALGSGLTWAATVLGLRWMTTRSGDPLAVQRPLVAGNAIACLAALPLALPVAAVSATDVTIVVFLGVFQIGLAYVCLAKGISGVTALEASLLLLLEPVLNPCWAWLVHGEQPSGWALAGGAVILGATTVRTLTARRVSSTAP